MAATRSSYGKLSRPTIGAGSSKLSSYVQTLARKQQAAEDAIIDNQYAAGNISADSYRNELTKRTARSTTTPVQNVELTKKINDVQQKLNDTEMERRYANGEVTTKDLHQYESAKLAQFGNQDNTAYQLQAKKVQGLQDKAEKEARVAYRTEQNLRISNLPDNSANVLSQKAKLYQELEHQARLDGDFQAADNFAASKVNYQSSADRAARSDSIAQTRLSLSQTPTGGGVPPAASGSSPVQGSSVSRVNQPAQAMATVGGNTPSRVIASAGGGNTQIAPVGNTDAPWLQYATHKGSDRLGNIEKSIQTTEQELQKNDAWKQEYEKQYNAAPEGSDEKAQYGQQLQDLNNRGVSLQDSLRTHIDSYQTAGESAQNAQEKSTKAAISKWKAVEERNQNLDEAELTDKLRNGQISKDQYLTQRYALERGRLAFADKVDQAYTSINEPDIGVAYKQTVHDKIDNNGVIRNLVLTNGADKLSDPNQIKQHLQNFGANYEMVRDDNTGEVAVKPFAQIRRDNKFTGSWIRDPKGILVPVHDTGDLDSSTGLPVNKASSRTNVLLGQTKPYYIGADGKKHDAVPIVTKTGDGKGLAKLEFHTKEFLAAPENKGKFVQSTTVSGSKMAGTNPVYEFKPAAQKPGFPQNVLNAAGGFVNNLIHPQQPAPNPVTKQDVNRLMNPLSPQVKPAAPAGFPTMNFLNGTQPNKQTNAGGNNFIGNAIGAAQNAIGNIVPKAYAEKKVPVKQQAVASNSLVTGTPSQYANVILDAAKKNGVPPNVLSALLKAESNFNPNARSPVGAIGIAQFMPATAAGMGIDPNDPIQAIDGAARYLAGKIKQHGSIPLALASYNAGSGNVEKYGGIPPFKETQDYVSKIMSWAGQPGMTQQQKPMASQTTKNFTPTFDTEANWVRQQQAKGNKTGQKELVMQYRKTNNFNPPKIETAVSPAATAAIKNLSQQKLPVQQASMMQPPGMQMPIPKNNQVTPTPYKSIVPGVTDSNKNGRIDAQETVLGKVVTGAARGVNNFFTKPVAPAPAPKIVSPIPQAQRYIPPTPPRQTGFQQVVSNVSHAAQPIVQGIQHAASNVGNFLQQFNPFAPKKKK